MSGKKETYVNLTTTAYNKMMNATREVDNIDSKIRDKLNSQEQQLTSQFNQQMDRANSRFSEQERISKRLSSDMRTMEKDFSKKVRQQDNKIREQHKAHQKDILKIDRKIEKQGKEFDGKLNNQRKEYIGLIKEQGKVFDRKLENQRSEYTSLINQQEKSFNHKLDNQRDEYTGLINQQGKEFSKRLHMQGEELHGRIDSLANTIEQKEAYKKSVAQTLLNDTDTFIEIARTYERHEQFKPNELNLLREELESYKRDFNNGMYESVISSVRQTQLRVNRLRNELHLLHLEWDAYHTEAIKSNNELIAICESQELVKLAFDVEEGVEELDVQIDYWSEGRLSELKDKAEEKKRLLKVSDGLSIDDFKQEIQESEELKKIVLNLTEEAKEAFLLSQLRQNYAEDIADVLEESHFEVTDSCYKGNNETQSLHLKMENPSGDEIVTVITPMDNRTNKINVNFYDEAGDENLRKARLKGILKSLSEQGLEVDNPVCVDTKVVDTDEESTKDFNRIRATAIQRRNSFQ